MFVLRLLTTVKLKFVAAFFVRLVRHLYFPSIRMNMSKSAAMFTVFTVSAILHEVLVSVPFHIIRPWSFLGMMMQIPLVAITKYLYRKNPGSFVGNIFLVDFLCKCFCGTKVFQRYCSNTGYPPLSYTSTGRRPTHGNSHVHGGLPVREISC